MDLPLLETNPPITGIMTGPSANQLLTSSHQNNFANSYSHHNQQNTHVPMCSNGNGLFSNDGAGLCPADVNNSFQTSSLMLTPPSPCSNDLSPPLSTDTANTLIPQTNWYNHAANKTIRNQPSHVHPNQYPPSYSEMLANEWSMNSISAGNAFNSNSPLYSSLYSHQNPYVRTNGTGLDLYDTRYSYYNNYTNYSNSFFNATPTTLGALNVNTGGGNDPMPIYSTPFSTPNALMVVNSSPESGVTSSSISNESPTLLTNTAGSGLIGSNNAFSDNLLNVVDTLHNVSLTDLARNNPATHNANNNATNTNHNNANGSRANSDGSGLVKNSQISYNYNSDYSQSQPNVNAVVAEQDKTRQASIEKVAIRNESSQPMETNIMKSANQNNLCNTMSNDNLQSAQKQYEWLTTKVGNFSPANTGKTRTKDKYRVVYTENQRFELEKEFLLSRYITIKRKSELAKELNLSERQVKIWFQNRRAKDRKQKRKKTEVTKKEKEIINANANNNDNINITDNAIIVCDSESSLNLNNPLHTSHNINNHSHQPSQNIHHQSQLNSYATSGANNQLHYMNNINNNNTIAMVMDSAAVGNGRLNTISNNNNSPVSALYSNVQIPDPPLCVQVSSASMNTMSSGINSPANLVIKIPKPPPVAAAAAAAAARVSSSLFTDIYHPLVPVPVTRSCHHTIPHSYYHSFHNSQTLLTTVTDANFNSYKSQPFEANSVATSAISHHYLPPIQKQSSRQFSSEHYNNNLNNFTDCKDDCRNMEQHVSNDLTPLVVPVNAVYPNSNCIGYISHNLNENDNNNNNKTNMGTNSNITCSNHEFNNIKNVDANVILGECRINAKTPLLDEMLAPMSNDYCLLPNRPNNSAVTPIVVDN